MSVILVDDSGNKLGNFSIAEAEKRAKESGKDLVMVNAKNQVYRIADAGKLKYEQKQKEKRIKAQNRAHKVKEVKMKPNIDEHDLKIKEKRIVDFLEKDLKTKVTIMFTRRHMRNLSAFHQSGRDILKGLIEKLEGFAKADKGITKEGLNLTVFFIPERK